MKRMEGRTDEEQVKRAEGLKGRMKRKRMSGALVAVNIKPADTPAHIHHSPPPFLPILDPSYLTREPVRKIR